MYDIVVHASVHVPGVTCVVVLPSRYTKMTQFGGLGCVGDAYIR